jgi:putative transcriptional regulator
LIRFKLAEMLEKRDKTMYQLSKESGIRPNTISQWYNNDELRHQLDEKGNSKDVKAISVDVLDKICKAIDCSIEDLIEYVPDNDNKPSE